MIHAEGAISEFAKEQFGRGWDTSAPLGYHPLAYGKIKNEQVRLEYQLAVGRNQTQNNMIRELGNHIANQRETAMTTIKAAATGGG